MRPPFCESSKEPLDQADSNWTLLGAAADLYCPGSEIKAFVSKKTAITWLLLGTGGVSKTDEFSEKFQTAFDPPSPHFRKIVLQFF